MGNALSDLLDTKKKDKNEAQAVHDLELLQKLVDSQLDKFEAELNAKFLSPDSAAKTQIPGRRAMRTTRFSTCEVKQEPSNDVNSAIDNFFGAASGGDQTKDKILTGFKSVVNAALKHFLGNYSIGEQKESKYFVYMLHNAVVRVDVMLWRWNFTDEGLGKTYKTALGYYMCLSVVDVASLTVPEFVFVISEYSGDDADAVQKYSAAMGKMYADARKLKMSETTPPKIE